MNEEKAREIKFRKIEALGAVNLTYKKLAALRKALMVDLMDTPADDLENNSKAMAFLGQVKQHINTINAGDEFYGGHIYGR